MAVYPYDYRKARFAHPNLNGYWVRVFLLFDGTRTYTFFNNAEAIENGSLANEIEPNSCTYLQVEVLVTPDKHKEIYQAIEDFENNVLKSNFD